MSRRPCSTVCTVEYVDAISREEAVRLFPEIEAERLVEPTHLRDLDRQGLEGLLRTITTILWCSRT